MNDKIKELYKSILIEKDKLENRLKLLSESIENMQKICTHTYEDGKTAYENYGHDHNYTYEKCCLCGHTKSE